MNRLKTYENFNEEEPFKKDEYIVLSLRNKIIMIKITSNAFDSKIPGFLFCSVVSLFPKEGIMDILYYNKKTKKYVHVAAKLSLYKILWRGNDYDEAYKKWKEEWEFRKDVTNYNL
jgi:hypothetical protein